MVGYDEAYASAQSDLEKLSILEAQKQAIVAAKKKGVTKAKKASETGKLLDAQQQRLAALEAELDVLFSHVRTADVLKYGDLFCSGIFF